MAKYLIQRNVSSEWTEIEAQDIDAALSIGSSGASDIEWTRGWNDYIVTEIDSECEGCCGQSCALPKAHEAHEHKPMDLLNPEMPLHLETPEEYDDD